MTDTTYQPDDAPLFVSSDDIAHHLRLDDDDGLLGIGYMASAMVRNYVGPSLDSVSLTITHSAVPHAVRAATLLLCGYIYRYRDQEWPGVAPGQLPASATAILYPMRGPTIA